MVPFLELPAELRQQILLSALPQTIVLSPSVDHPITNFLLICKHLRRDFEEIAHHYDPIYIVAEPHHLKYLKKHRPATSRVTRVSLQIFSPAPVGIPLDRYFSLIVSMEIDTMLGQWIENLAAGRSPLPKSGLKGVSIDITPIPFYGRSMSRNWILWFINRSTVSNRLFNMYEVRLGEVVAAVGTLLKTTSQRQRPALMVIGTLSPKSRDRIPTVMRESLRLQDEGVHMVSEMEWKDDSENLKWETLLEHLQVEYDTTPEGRLKKALGEVKQNLRYIFERNRRYRTLFERSAFADSEWTQEVMLELANLAASDNISEQEGKMITLGSRSIVYERVEPLKRALLHQTAEALGMMSETSDERIEGWGTCKNLEVMNHYGEGLKGHGRLQNDSDAAGEYTLVEQDEAQG